MVRNWHMTAQLGCGNDGVESWDLLTRREGP
jgi:hypothetical protein